MKAVVLLALVLCIATVALAASTHRHKKHGKHHAVKHHNSNAAKRHHNNNAHNGQNNKRIMDDETEALGEEAFDEVDDNALLVTTTRGPITIQPPFAITDCPPCNCNERYAYDGFNESWSSEEDEDDDDDDEAKKKKKHHKRGKREAGDDVIYCPQCWCPPLEDM